MPINRFIVVDGRFQGNYSESAPIPDAGTTFNLHGSGSLKGFGHASVKGQFHSIGFIAVGNVHGTIQLKVGNSTLTLSLTGPVQRGGFNPLPTQYDFRVTGATGKFAHDFDVGTAKLVLTPGSTNPAQQDSFTLALTGSPLP
jgi:hypothetical protein